MCFPTVGLWFLFKVDTFCGKMSIFTWLFWFCFFEPKLRVVWISFTCNFVLVGATRVSPVSYTQLHMILHKVPGSATSVLWMRKINMQHRCHSIKEASIWRNTWAPNSGCSVSATKLIQKKVLWRARFLNFWFLKKSHLSVWSFCPKLGV